MIRWKFTFDKEEEEDWLNDWCGQGWAMTRFCAGVVTFVPCRPGEFIYQIDLLPGKGLAADNYEDYVIFMHELGVEVLQRWGRWVYLRRRAEDGPFEIYSDAASRCALYRRIRRMFLWALAIELLCSFSVWSLLARYPGDLFTRALAGLYVVMLALLTRGVRQSSARIRALGAEDESQGGSV